MDVWKPLCHQLIRLHWFMQEKGREDQPCQGGPKIIPRKNHQLSVYKGSYEVNLADIVSEYCLAFSDTNSVIPIISSSRAMTSFPLIWRFHQEGEYLAMPRSFRFPLCSCLYPASMQNHSISSCSHRASSSGIPRGPYPCRRHSILSSLLREGSCMCRG